MLAPPLIATSVRSAHASRATYFLMPATASAPAGSGDRARVLEDILDGGADLIRGHQHDFIDVLPREAKRLLAHPPHRDAVGEYARPARA